MIAVAALLCASTNARVAAAADDATARPPLWATLPDVPALPRPAAAGSVPNDGALIHYAVFGRHRATPVILLHGGLASSASWGFEVPRLARRHRVVVIDSRGHGRSTMPPGPLHYRQMATDVIAVMDQLRLSRTAIVGLSDGGIVGLLLASDHPERVDRLLVWGAAFNTHADSDAPPDPAIAGMGGRFMARMQADYRAVSPTPNAFPTLRSALGRLYATEPDLSPADLGRIRTPTIVADGDHEQFIARAHTAALARQIPGARMVILPNVSHGGPQQDPVAFHRLVATLLDDPAR